MHDLARRPRSLSEVAIRATGGDQPFDPAVREFLDAWQSMSPKARADALIDEPCHAGQVQDAYLGALAEHLASEAQVPLPAWCGHPSRFLRQPFFAGGLESLKAILIAESPAAFRRRLIFVSADALSRPRRGFVEEDASHVRNLDG